MNDHAAIDTRPFVITQGKDVGHKVTIRHAGHELVVTGTSEDDGLTYVFEELNGARRALGRVETTELGNRRDEVELIFQYFQQVEHDWLPEDLHHWVMATIDAYQFWMDDVKAVYPKQ